MNISGYEKLAEALNNLPNGFPPDEERNDIRILEYLFNEVEAETASNLLATYETAKEIAARIEADYGETRKTLKALAKRGLIKAGKSEGGLGYALMPFVVGFYEEQVNTIDKEFAQIFEDYYKSVSHELFRLEPQFHRVIPINESIEIDMEIHPHESLMTFIDEAQAWGVQDCICRKQKELIDDGCDHPMEVCMVFYSKPNVFDSHPYIKPLTKDEAKATLQLAARSGLVPTVSNRQDGRSYICNCCSCSCGILRGIQEFGISNVVSKSPFLCSVDEDLCGGCEICVEECQFEAIDLATGFASIIAEKCVGCGLCVVSCPDEAMSMIRRNPEEQPFIPDSSQQWKELRMENK